jgi:hypothetical protein
VQSVTTPPAPTAAHRGTTEECVSLEVLRGNAERRIAERRAWLLADDEDARLMRALRVRQQFGVYMLFPPLYPCLWTFEKQPGRAVLIDGGKWVCGLSDLHRARPQQRQQQQQQLAVAPPGTHSRAQSTMPLSAYDPPCLVYSFGSKGEFSFEKYVKETAPLCRVVTFDPTYHPDSAWPGWAYVDTFVDSHGLAGRVQAGNASAGLLPLQTLQWHRDRLGHGAATIDVLKVDIESDEWSFIPKTDWANARVGQLLVELHPHAIPVTAADFLPYFEHLEAAGYYLTGYEPVRASNMAQVEATFVHRDWTPRGWRQSISSN